jgi:hypothetical protein
LLLVPSRSGSQSKEVGQGLCREVVETMTVNSLVNSVHTPMQDGVTLEGRQAQTLQGEQQQCVMLRSISMSCYHLHPHDGAVFEYGTSSCLKPFDAPPSFSTQHFQLACMTGYEVHHLNQPACTLQPSAVSLCSYLCAELASHGRKFNRTFCKQRVFVTSGHVFLVR